MKIYILILFTILLVGCGKHDGQTRKFDVTDEAFLVYEDIFYEELMNYTGQTFRKDIPINFDETSLAGIDGQCHTYSNGDREILINPARWNSRDEEYREMIIMHELGHCYLDKQHTKTYTIMNSRAGDLADIYNENRDYMLEFFFTNNSEVLDLIDTSGMFFLPKH